MKTVNRKSVDKYNKRIGGCLHEKWQGIKNGTGRFFTRPYMEIFSTGTAELGSMG